MRVGWVLHALGHEIVFKKMQHVGAVSGEILRDFDADGMLSWR